jgi:hypothetical protein|tara:strand:+ start:611 stop:820 length:210 start_codon:yes stop_codon:yes gene_type:complete
VENRLSVKTSSVSKIKGYSGFIAPKQWEAKLLDLAKHIESSTGYVLVEKPKELGVPKMLDTYPKGKKAI